MRTVFMGTPELAVPAMRLLAERTELQLVITQPDRPAGRGKKLRAPPVKQAAVELGLPVWQPERLRGQHEDPRLQGMDLFVVMAYGEILDQALLDLPRECINLHASLLPAWRGASPLQAAIRAGDSEGGVSVMRMVRKLDAGPVFLREVSSMHDRLRLPEWHDRIAKISARALGRFLDAWPDIEAVEQDESQVSYCGKLTSQDGRIDFTQDCLAVDRQLRAYSPHPGCWALMDGQRLRIHALEPEPTLMGLAPGELRRVGDELLIGCGEGAVSLLRLQPPGGRVMDLRDFLNGHRLPERLI